MLVDEFQDVNLVQYRLMRVFVSAHENICVVGDDDQSIYQWRGADVRNIRGFTRDYPGARLVKLEQNYRSSGHIVSAALGVIRPAAERQPKELWTANDPGEPVTVVHTATERDEASWLVGRIRKLIKGGLSPQQIAIFYRVHAQSRVLEEALRVQGIPYQVVAGHRFFDRAEVKDLLAYLRVIDNPASDVDLLRIINVPARKIGKKTVERLLGVARQQGLSASDAIGPLCGGDQIGAAAKRSLQAFGELMQRWQGRARTCSPTELAEQVLIDSGYARWLKAQDSAEADARMDNLRELLGSISEYEEEKAEAGEVATLSDYLARVALTADVDGLQDAERVSMMTVHAAKGLEFDSVFLTGAEEKLLPHYTDENLLQHRQSAHIEEERRLAYVAVTRARRQLAISHAEMRMIYGQTRYTEPSRFLRDLPPKDVRHTSTEALGGGSQQGSRFDRGSSRGGLAFGSRSPLGSPAARPARPAGAQKQRYVEPKEHYDEPGYDGFDDGEQIVVRPGARVRHRKFGIRKVKSVKSGPDPVVVVEFAGVGRKRIKLSFLSPA